MGIASIVLGIVGILLAHFMGGFWGAIVSLVGVILGVLGRKNPEQKSMATAGMICSIIGLVVGIAVWIACYMIASSATKLLLSQ